MAKVFGKKLLGILGIWGILGMLSIPGLVSAGQEVLRINTSIKPPFSTIEKDGFLDQLLNQLFQRIGRKVELVRLPAERALQMANDGASDGDLPRISGLSRKYPHLLEVPEPVVDYFFVAFSKRGNEIEDLDYSKLAGRNVGLIIGWKIYENNVPARARTVKVASPGQLMKLLDIGRIDVALYERYAGWNLIRSRGYRSIVECVPPLSIKPMHLYLHESHRPLVAIIDRALQEMKKDGSYQRLVAAILDSGE